MEAELISIRRFLHKNAEIGFELNETVSFVKSKLEEYGCIYSDCGKNGIVCLIGKENGKSILLRADMDALPIEEKTELEYACTNGNMHACGHDMHTSMLLGAAKILKSVENDLNGQAMLVFQPAEELLSGAKNMLENGLLSFSESQSGFMLHVMSALPIKSGTAIVASAGVSAPGADNFTINVQGISSHGSMPQQGADAILSASHIISALEQICSREIGLGDRAVLTIGKICGGTAANIVSDSVTLQGTLRAFDEELRSNIKKRICEISQQVAVAYKTKACISFDNGCPTLINDETMSRFACEQLSELLGKENVIFSNEMGSSFIGGSEDFSYVSHSIPSVMVALSAGEREKGYTYPQHHPRVCFDEEALPVGAAIYSYIAIKYLQ